MSEIIFAKIPIKEKVKTATSFTDMTSEDKSELLYELCKINNLLSKTMPFVKPK